MLDKVEEAASEGNWEREKEWERERERERERETKKGLEWVSVLDGD